MSNPKTPLLTRVALADSWSAGWLRLRAADGWPQMALDLLSEVGDDLAGKRRWIGRRRAMRLLTEVLHECGCTDLAGAAKLMATDPTDAHACSEIAHALAVELGQHNIGDAVGEVIRGWAELGSGLTVDELDPIKAAHKAAAMEKHAPSDDDPSPEKLDASPILDDWEFLTIEGSSYRAARGVVAGDIRFQSGQTITTSVVVKNDLGLTWIRTANSIYRLGFRHHEHPPILRCALKGTRLAAYHMLYGITGKHTLPDDVRDAAIMAGMNIDLPSLLGAAKVVGDELAKHGRKLLARGWLLLAADAAKPDTCTAVQLFLLEAAEFEHSDAAHDVLTGWGMLAAGETFGEDLSDPIAAARLIGERCRRKPAYDVETDDEPVRGSREDGVVVVGAIGGVSASSHARDVREEFKDMVGVRVPLAAVPDVAKVRATLVSEFPHAEAVIDVMLSDLVGREHVKFRTTLLVGPAGSGKTRLARRIAEVCGLYVHAFDGAGASDAAFGGTGRRWNTGEPCWTLIGIKAAGHANPMIVVDEIDKSGTSKYNGNLVNSLLPVLERETAKRFPDPYVQAPIDISHVSYVLTANSDVELPKPLKDRCRLLHMPPIAAEHVPAIAAGIVKDIAADKGLDPRWLSALDGDEIEIARRLLRDGSIRRLRAIVEKLLAARETIAMRN
jgi:hypothetical protein